MRAPREGRAARPTLVLWHAGVLCSGIALALAVLSGSWALTLAAAAATVLLHRTSALVPVPRVYRELGVTEEIMMGRDRGNRA